MLAPKTNGSQALQLCSRLRAATAVQVFLSKGKPLPVTLSIGIAVAGSDPETELDGLLQLAAKRAALARAKGGDTALADEGAPVAAAPVPAESAATQAAPACAIKAEEGLALLASHQEARLEPHLVALLLELVPLLEFGNQKLNLSIGFAITSMKNRLQGLRGYEE
jgi:GGDEF domain-containing protein